MENEYDLWTENASMRDFIVNPFHWFFTACTLGVYFLVVYLGRLNTRYRLTNQRLIVTKGLLSKKVDEVELFRVKDSKMEQSFLNRLVGLGTITVYSTDNTGNLRITHISSPTAKREQIRTAAAEQRSVKGVQVRINE